MNPITTENIVQNLSSESLGTIVAHISGVDAKISKFSIETFDGWKGVILKEFPSVEIEKADECLGKYLGLLNRTLFSYLSGMDPTNLKYIREKDVKDDEEPVKVYEQLNQWLQDVYGKMTLAQVLAEPPNPIIPEHETVIRKKLNDVVEQNEGKIAVIHLPDTSLSVAAATADSLTEMTDHQLGLILSFIDSQQRPLSLSLINVFLRDDQLDPICKLLRTGKLQLLNLSNNRITDEGARKLSESLSDEGCVAIELVLDGNNLRADGAKELIVSIQDNVRFTLSLRNNNIAPDMFEELTESVIDPFSSASVQLE